MRVMVNVIVTSLLTNDIYSISSSSFNSNVHSNHELLKKPLAYHFQTSPMVIKLRRICICRPNFKLISTLPFWSPLCGRVARCAKMMTGVIHKNSILMEWVAYHNVTVWIDIFGGHDSIPSSVLSRFILANYQFGYISFSDINTFDRGICDKFTYICVYTHMYNIYIHSCRYMGYI